jgi:hypothetical protein
VLDTGALEPDGAVIDADNMADEEETVGGWASRRR